MTQAWYGWLHSTCTLFGNWLRGDPRGWRSRKHRRHVEGDYRSPPADGLHDGLYDWSRTHMKRSAVRLPMHMRAVVIDAFVDELLVKDCAVRIAAVDDHHLHALLRPPDDRSKHWLGFAKKNSAYAARDFDDSFTGGIWARGSRCEPMKDCSHYRNTVEYIARHADRGAVLWVHPRYRSASDTIDP